jgi:hypothetical protein
MSGGIWAASWRTGMIIHELAWMDLILGLVLVPLDDRGRVLIDFDVGEPTEQV